MKSKKSKSRGSTKKEPVRKSSARDSQEKLVRINAFIARTGITSRRGADNLIKDGKIKVNDRLLKDLGVKINPQKDKVKYKNRVGLWETIDQEEYRVIYALNKPRGYVTSMRKQGKSPIIKSLIPAKPRVFPVGRLDKESEGLMILTNMGKLAFSLVHPKKHIEKKYRVHCTIPKRLTENSLKSHLGRVAKGVRLDDKKTLPMEIKLKRYLRPGMVELEITLREGRYRQIRRVLGKINLEVVRLIRTHVGKLSLNKLKLKTGSYKKISEEDIL